MNFLWPDALWLLLAIPLLIAGYVALQRRRKRNAVRFAQLDLVRAAAGPAQRLRRHLPPALLAVALAALLFALSRPTAVVTLPSDQRTIILAIDVSLSMRATDVDPSRIAAAQTAAKSFVLAQPPDVRIGIVTFAGSASVVQAPTQNRDDLVAAIDRFQLQRSTAIGSGIIMSLATLFPDDGIDLESLVLGQRGGRGEPRGAAVDREPRPEKKAHQPVAPGSYPSAAIILLTDGRRTTGPDSLAAAQMAAQHGVRVYTVGFGTAEGSNVGIDGMSIFMRFDEEALKAIAGITQAEYFHAASAAELERIYEKLNARFVLDRKEIEITALLAAAAALLALLAGGLSLRWFRRNA
ncbi:MAG: VWA domain-containing protein [Betaproteobacteria bacterium]|nr:VWA domain-containing protein [Betaproteobacteria bacterium]